MLQFNNFRLKRKFIFHLSCGKKYYYEFSPKTFTILHSVNQQLKSSCSIIEHKFFKYPYKRQLWWWNKYHRCLAGFLRLPPCRFLPRPAPALCAGGIAGLHEPHLQIPVRLHRCPTSFYQ